MDKLANLTRSVDMCCFLEFGDAKESCFLLIQSMENLTLGQFQVVKFIQIKFTCTNQVSLLSNTSFANLYFISLELSRIFSSCFFIKSCITFSMCSYTLTGYAQRK